MLEDTRQVRAGDATTLWISDDKQENGAWAWEGCCCASWL